jgi:hypothetical protein
MEAQELWVLDWWIAATDEEDRLSAEALVTRRQRLRNQGVQPQPFSPIGAELVRDLAVSMEL